MALITAELSSAFPDNGGYSLWVSEAFGPFWGFQESYWCVRTLTFLHTTQRLKQSGRSLFSGLVDSALYPGLVWSTVVNLLNKEDLAALPSGSEYAIKVFLATIFTLPSCVLALFFRAYITALLVQH